MVDPANSTRLAQRLRQAGAEAELKLYPRIGHKTLIGSFARPLRFLSPALTDTAVFLRRVTAKSATRQLEAGE